jgi:hypothetical protein
MDDEIAPILHQLDLIGRLPNRRRGTCPIREHLLQVIAIWALLIYCLLELTCRYEKELV